MIEVDLDFLEAFEPRSRERVVNFVACVAGGLIRLGRDTPRRVEGLPLPSSPVIFATNHSHVLDFLPLWLELLSRGEHLVGLVKARMYKNARNRTLMRWIGNNLPIVSRGYLIAADFRGLMGRRPTDEEYRNLRDHLDLGHSLPEKSPYREVTRTPREILGRSFRPEAESYRAAMCDLYYRMMQHMVDSARVYVGQGHHIHIYPEGQIAQCLTRGHTGVVHLALALELDIVPVGVSGTREAFLGNTPLTKGGEFRVRFGEPLRVAPDLVPRDFRPFHPIDQHQNEETLQSVADEVMQRLDGLVDGDYGFPRRQKLKEPDGVERFY